jgi:hypothetical protein
VIAATGRLGTPLLLNRVNDPAPLLFWIYPSRSSRVISLLRRVIDGLTQH